MTYITYNGIDLFSGIGPTPFVARNDSIIRYGQRHGQVINLTLNGELTGITCGEAYLDILLKQQELLDRLGENFKSLVIYDDEPVFSGSCCIVRNVNFGDSKYVGILPYSIDLSVYPEELFSGVYGILNPSDSTEYVENTDGTVEINHTVSAQGFNTNENYSNALENARNYVHGLTGVYGVLPALININTGIPAKLRTVSENIDRLNATYSLTETYVVDPNDSGNGILRYSTTLDSGFENGITTIGLKGSVLGGLNDTFDSIRTRYNSLDTYTLASIVTGLNSGYLSSGVDEDSFAKRLSFDIIFNDDPQPQTYFEYRSSLDTDYLTEVSTFSFDGSVKGRGDIRSRWQRVQSYYTGLDVPSLVQAEYTGYNLTYPLNPKFVSSGTTFNSFAAQIDISLSYNNKSTAPSGLELLDYQIDFNPSLIKYSSVPLIDTSETFGYQVFNLGYSNREAISINGRAQVDGSTTLASGIQILKNTMNDLVSTYVTGAKPILEQNNITTGAGQGKTVGFTFAWSHEGEIFDLFLL